VQRRVQAIWRQASFPAINPKTKGALILERSDGALNPFGVRFGSARMIYAVVKMFSEFVNLPLCVGQRRRDSDKDKRVLLLLEMPTEHMLSPKILGKIT
jgi:acetoacetyl-CoA synthetase